MTLLRQCRDAWGSSRIHQVDTWSGEKLGHISIFCEACHEVFRTGIVRMSHRCVVCIRASWENASGHFPLFFWNYGDSHLDVSLLLEVPVWHGNNQAANPFYTRFLRQYWNKSHPLILQLIFTYSYKVKESRLVIENYYVAHWLDMWV